MSDEIGAKRTGTGQSALSDRVHKNLTELIRNRTLASGQVIIETRLAEQLGVSRTPLREALQRLEGEGMIEKNAGRSFMVRRVDVPEYMQSLKMRLIIEPEAGVLAMNRIPATELEDVRREVEHLHSNQGEHTQAHWDSDDKLHRLYGLHSRNAVMFEITERLRVTTRLFEITDIHSRIEADFQEHSAILNALESRVAENVRQTISAHIQSLIAYSLEQIS